MTILATLEKIRDEVELSRGDAMVRHKKHKKVKRFERAAEYWLGRASAYSMMLNDLQVKISNEQKRKK